MKDTVFQGIRTGNGSWIKSDLLIGGSIVPSGSEFELDASRVFDSDTELCVDDEILEIVLRQKE